MTLSDIIEENKKRITRNRKTYNPLTGEGCDCGNSGERTFIEVPDAPTPSMWLPAPMMRNAFIQALVSAGTLEGLLLGLNIDPTRAAIDEVWKLFIKVRIQYDFENWAYQFTEIKDKNSGDDIPFYLNRGQRKLLRVLMDDFEAGVPIRVILDKARQWGGSTLVQLFMVWIQLVHVTQWNSIIAAHVDNTAKLVQGMLTKVLEQYPPWLLDVSSKIELRPFERSTKTRYIKERGCKITTGSAESPNSIRGGDEAMAHLTEITSWKATAGKKPEDLIQSVISGIRLLPKTMIVLESTAKGVGNFFHRECLRAIKKESSFKFVFVAFFDIDDYSYPIKNYRVFIESMSAQEMGYFTDGATLEAIAWRREKLKEYADEWRFMSEYPGNATESFQSTGRRFYPIGDVARLRKGCSIPKFVGEIYGKSQNGKDALLELKTKMEREGALSIWAMPGSARCTTRYVVVVDIGGRSEKADNSCIAVFDRFWMTEAGVPEVVAEWCGHIDHDLLAWKAAQIAKFYHNALLVIESNTLETEETEGDHFEYILDEIADAYPFLFSRTPADKIKEGVPARWGFHTNKSSKQMVCDHQKKALREDMYIENCAAACDEHDTLEVKENGSLGAVEGRRDDRHITRAIGVWVCYQYLPPPKIMEETTFTRSRSVRGDGVATI